MTELTAFPNVLCPNDKIAYGGSQKWFRDPWRSLSGCAAVSGVNLAAYYRIGMRPDVSDAEGAAPVYSQEVYRAQMNLMFREYMRSGRMGFPDPEKYIEKFIAYAARYETDVVPVKLYGWDTTDDATAFFLTRLQKGNPVALLILQHTAKELDDITWHWMTITGYDDARKEILISNYGRREIYAAETVFEPSNGNQVYLISFDVAKKEEETWRS